MAEAYSLSAQIIIKLTEHDVSVGLLMQLDKVSLINIHSYLNMI